MTSKLSLLRCLATLMVFCSGFAVSHGKEPVKVSFLETDEAREDTIRILQDAGCPEPDVKALRRAILHYYKPPFTYDISLFPRQENGFYEFQTIDKFIDSLPLRLCMTDHLFELTCTDTAILIAGHDMSTTSDFDSLTGPYLAISVSTNGVEHPVPTASLKDAYDVTYFKWYQELLLSVFKREVSEHHKALAVSLFRFNPVPIEIDEDEFSQSLHAVLKMSWSRNGVEFPKDMFVTILHRVRTDYHMAVSDHLGVLVKIKGGYMYVEKAGGRGPFLRIDVSTIDDIARYYSTMMSQDYPYNFMTVNNDRIITLE